MIWLDLHACSIMVTTRRGEGVLSDRHDIVGHVPLEISRYCWFFLIRGGTIKGKVVDLTTRRSPIPSSGLEMKLDLTFSGSTPLVQKMKELVMDRYEWEYSGQLAEAPQAQVDSQDDLDL